MYSANDFEKLWFLYKTEGEPKGISLNSFCVSHGVSLNPSEGMSPEEMSRYIQFLFEQIQQKDAQHKELLEQIAGIKSELKQANTEQKRLNALVLSLTNQLNEALQANAEQSRIIADLQSSARVSKKHRFGSSSQKGILKKKEVAGRDE